MNNVPFNTIGEISRLAEIPYSYLRDILFLKENPYRTFKISKKNSKEKRLILVPKPALLSIQKIINRYIVQQILPHKKATAYVSGTSPILNAKYHTGSEYLIKIDLKDFFHHFDERDLYKLYLSFGYNKLLAFQLSRLSVKINYRELSYSYKSDRIFPEIPRGRKFSYMPQGAPTSPGLSNLLMYKIDKEIDFFANYYNFRYSRYSDDITLSTQKKVDFSIVVNLSNRIKKMLKKRFTINEKKSNIFHKGQRMIVTGLTVNSNTPKPTKEYLNNLRLQIYYIKRNGYLKQAQIKSYEPYAYYQHIWGKIHWIKQIDENLGKKFESQLQGIKNPFT